MSPNVPVKLVRTRKFHDITILTKPIEDTSTPLAIEVCADSSETVSESEVETTSDLVCVAPRSVKRSDVLKVFEEKGYSATDLLCKSVERGKAGLLAQVINRYPQLNLNVCDENLMTPLHIAVLSHRDFIVGLLISKGARWDMLDYFNYTPLIIAIINNQIKIVQACVDSSNGDINKQGLSGWTPLHFAVIENRNECVDILLKKRGINVMKKDYFEKTPYDYAVQKQNKEIVEKLYLVYKRIARETGQRIRLPVLINRLSDSN
jgi:hypothetical protein